MKLKTHHIMWFGSLAFLALSFGCALFQTAAPLAVPAATCAILKNQPAAQPYLTSVEQAVRRFSAGALLDSESLRDALIGVKIDGVEPYVASGIYTVVVVAYSGLAERYATDPTKEIHLRSALVAIADGLAAGLSQCGIPKQLHSATLRAAPHVIQEKNLKKLANAMAKSIKK